VTAECTFDELVDWLAQQRDVPAGCAVPLAAVIAHAASHGPSSGSVGAHPVAVICAALGGPLVASPSRPETRRPCRRRAR